MYISRARPTYRVFIQDVPSACDINSGCAQCLLYMSRMYPARRVYVQGLPSVLDICPGYARRPWLGSRMRPASGAHGHELHARRARAQEMRSVWIIDAEYNQRTGYLPQRFTKHSAYIQDIHTVQVVCPGRAQGYRIYIQHVPSD